MIQPCPHKLLLLFLTAAMSCGYAAAQDADKNPWMAEVAKAAADGRCDEAKTIALRNGSLDVAERVLKLCTPSKATAPAVQPVQAETVQHPLPPVILPATKQEISCKSSLVEKKPRMRAPSAKEIAKYYPPSAKAAKISGSVNLQCKASRLGVLGACRVVGEAPMGQGFGEAALSLAAFIQVTPGTLNGVPLDGSRILFPIVFQSDGGKPPQPAGIESAVFVDVEAFIPSAELGDKSAQWMLGTFYSHGTPKDDTLAASWYRKSADQGCTLAQNDLKALCAAEPTTTGCPYP